MHLAILLSLFVTSTAVEPASVAGEWNVVLELAEIRGQPRLVLKQDGEKITGVYVGRYGEAPLQGSVKEKDIEFTVRLNVEGTEITGYFGGVVAGDSMGGTVEFEGAGEGTWTASRVTAKK
ncbi:MAG TPA: hypothetical protein VD833_08430 [Vicinamibacterales bacterium]|nr:hypothetical protein [Vicinamibacterales bacterium]